MDNSVQKLGRYELLALLASGGMAEIHLARQTGIQGFERLVVIKKIHPHLAREERFVEMFFDEARIAAQLNHPNIVQIYDLGHEGSEYFIAMQYLEGESLSTLVQEGVRSSRPLPQELAAGIIAQVCDGLDHAHRLLDSKGKPLNIVHRDVSPQNIVVEYSGVVKLLDFGVAKAASRIHHTRSGAIKGKIAYMSPEQCRGKSLDGRSDIFSLGVVFWELLTQTRLFKRDNDVAAIEAIALEPIPTVRQVEPGVSEHLALIADKALERNPNKRYQTAAEMAAAIRAALGRMEQTAGMADIAAHMEIILGDKIRTKKDILNNLQRGRKRRMPLRILKPDTDESLPSASVRSAMSGALLKTLLRHPSESLRRSATWLSRLLSVLKTRRKAQWVAGLLVIIGGGLIWLATVPGSPPAEPPPPVHIGSVNPVPRAGSATAPDKPAAPRPETFDLQEPSPLEVLSTPEGCTVEVDGTVAAGVTPLKGIILQPNVEHEVIVICEHHQPETRMVIGLPGQELRMDVAPRKMPETPQFGRLRLDSKPWSLVYWRKKELGMTPLTDVTLPVGRHKLTLVNAPRNLRKVVWIQITAGKTTVKRFSL